MKKSLELSEEPQLTELKVMFLFFLLYTSIILIKEKNTLHRNKEI